MSLDAMVMRMMQRIDRLESLQERSSGVEKLGSGGVANRLVKDNGTNVVMGQLVAADVTANTLTSATLAAHAVHNLPVSVNHSGGAVVATGGAQTVPGSTVGITTDPLTNSTTISWLTSFSASVNGTVITLYVALNGGLALFAGNLTVTAPGWHYTYSGSYPFALAANTGYAISLQYVANAGTITWSGGNTTYHESKR